MTAAKHLSHPFIYSQFTQFKSVCKDDKGRLEWPDLLINELQQDFQDKSELSEWLEITEGTPYLGVTSYWTDAEGNVVFDPNTPKEKMKTSVTGRKTPKRKEAVATAPAQKVEDKQESKSRELETGKTADDAPTEPKSSKSDQPVDAKKNLSEQPPTADNSDALVQLAETVKEHETA